MTMQMTAGSKAWAYLLLSMLQALLQGHDLVSLLLDLLLPLPIPAHPHSQCRLHILTVPRHRAASEVYNAHCGMAKP